MPAWLLRVCAMAITLVSMMASTTYALAHPKNPNAPLHPPVADRAPALVLDEVPTPMPRTPRPTAAPTSAAPTAAVAMAASTARPVAATTLAPTRTPALTARPATTGGLVLQAGVRATSLPRVTYTHSS